MEQTPNQLIYWDSHRRPINITFICALAIVVIGLMTFINRGEWQFLVIGLAATAYTWLTNPKHYRIYPDALFIHYGSPRIRAIPFSQVSHVELLSLPIGDRIRVRLTNGRSVMLMVKDSEKFQTHLDEALEKFNSSHPREESHQEDSRADA